MSNRGLNINGLMRRVVGRNRGWWSSAEWTQVDQEPSLHDEIQASISIPPLAGRPHLRGVQWKRRLKRRNGEKEQLSCSFRTIETKRTDSHLQGTANWASSNPGDHVSPFRRTPHQFPGLPMQVIASLRASLPIITSLALSEFALELRRTPTEFTQPALKLWGSWGGIDKLFNNFLDRGLDFKLVTRTGKLYSRDELAAQAKERFPLTGRDRIRFETSLAVDEYWTIPRRAPHQLRQANSII